MEPLPDTRREEIRAAARARIDVPGTEPVRWRVVMIEYGGGIAPVCDATSYTGITQTHATHTLDDGERDDLGLYDCCPSPHIEVWSDAMSEYLVALLNADTAMAPAELTRWAEQLQSADLTPQPAFAFCSTTTGYEVAAQVATTDNLTDAARERLLTELQAAFDETVRRVLGYRLAAAVPAPAAPDGAV